MNNLESISLHCIALGLSCGLLAACNNDGAGTTADAAASTTASTTADTTADTTAGSLGSSSDGGGESNADGGTPPTTSSGESTDDEGGSTVIASDPTTSDTGDNSTGDTGGGDTSVVLPLEVLGPQGTTVSATFDLRGVADITRIVLECHACGFDDVALDSDPDLTITKGSLRVNGSDTAIPLKRYTGGVAPVGNPDILLPATAEAYGGIGGGFRTIRFSLPISGLVEGENTLVFEHTYASTESLGYRIVDIAFLRADDSEFPLPEGTFIDDDPAKWSPPRPDELTNGQALWQKRGILDDPAIDALNGDLGDGAIQASCADCHAVDGRDLKYFNYSNRSIVARSTFHGLSEAQGEQIASYIRSLALPIVAAARPWNPPYQPGPGLDARPVYEWAAGAGVDAVLAADVDLRSHLFPDGEAPDAVRGVVDRLSTLNMRELPVALQLPDWNRWLPRIHPRDSFDVKDPVVLADENGDAIDAPFFDRVYEEARKAGPGEEKQAITDVRDRLERWLGRDADCYTQSIDSGPNWRAANATVMGAVTLPPKSPLIVGLTECKKFRNDAVRMKPIELAKQGLAAWVSVKQWELVHAGAHEEAAMGLPPLEVKVSVDPDVKVLVPVGERGWFLEGFSVFFRAPHYIGHDSNEFTNQDRLIGTYETTSWYHLQLVLNAGYRQHVPPLNEPNSPDPPMPSHFPYTIVFMENLAQESGLADPFRFWATYIKIRQQQTNGHYGVENGLDLRSAQPYMLYSDNFGSPQIRDVGQPLWSHLATAMIEDLVADASIATPAQWAMANQNSDVQDPNDPKLDFTPFDFVKGKKPFDIPGPWQGTNTFRVIPQLREVAKVDEPTLDKLIDWAKGMWPGAQNVGKPAWEALKQP